MESLFSTIIYALVIALMVVPIYKWRHSIIRWIRDPKETIFKEWQPARTTIAKRRLVKAQWRLEDAESQLMWAEKLEQEEAETGD